MTMKNQIISPKRSKVAFQMEDSLATKSAFFSSSLPLEEDRPETSSSSSIVTGAMLQDKASREAVNVEKKQLQRLVSRQLNTLNTVGCHVNPHGSLRSIISEKMGASMTSLQKQLEQDITDATEEFAEFSMSMSEHHFQQGHLVFDLDESQQAWDSIHGEYEYDENEDGDEKEDGDDDSFHLPQPSERSMKIGQVKLSTGDTVPLRGATETWQAIKFGCTLATVCKECQADLHVIEDAAYIVCPNCWAVGPVEQTIGDIPLELDDSSDNYGLGLGVEAKEVLQWIDSQTH